MDVASHANHVTLLDSPALFVWQLLLYLRYLAAMKTLRRTEQLCPCHTNCPHLRGDSGHASRINAPQLIQL